MLLHSFEDDFTAVWGNVEGANIEVGREVGQLSLGTRLQVYEPEILVLNLSSQEHERPSSVQEGKVSSSPGQGQGWQGMRRSLGCDGFNRKGGANVGS